MAESVCAVKRGGAAGSPKMLNGLGHGERPAYRILLSISPKQPSAQRPRRPAESSISLPLIGLCPSLNSAGKLGEVVLTLQAPGESQHEQNDEDDSPDSDSAIGAVCVIPAATAKQQN
jgi:hypothetical protein